VRQNHAQTNIASLRAQCRASQLLTELGHLNIVRLLSGERVVGRSWFVCCRGADLRRTKCLHFGAMLLRIKYVTCYVLCCCSTLHQRSTTLLTL